MAVYLDLVMILNFLVDFLLILGTNRLSGFPVQWQRGAVAALLGAVYSGACLLPGFAFLGNTLWRLVSLALMASIAFGWNKSAMKRGGVFLLLSMALGGIALGMENGGFWAIILSAAGVWLLCRIGLGEGIGQEYVPVEITHEGRTVHYTALRDTGNTLRDPITGEEVLVLSADAAQTLCGISQAELQQPMEAMISHSGFRLIPYRAVGQPGGMLLARKFADVKIGNRRGSIMVAFAPENIGRGAVYQALAGGAMG